MLLEEFMEDPWAAYIKAERYVNEGSRSGLSNIHTTSERTQPKSSYPSFELRELGCGPDVILEDIGVRCNSYIKDGCMYVHPDMLQPSYLRNHDSYSIEGTVRVAPTASGRTVLVLGKEYFVKLAYLGYLGRLFRHVSREIILSACEVTKQLVAAVRNNSLNPAFSFLREDCGRVAHIPMAHFGQSASALPTNENACYELGVVFRESRPYPPVEEIELLVPFFALFSQEFSPTTGLPVAAQDKPLLIQLFEKQNKSIQDFLLNDILFPVFNTYFDALLFAGVEFEAHSQNVLLTIDSRFAVKRVVCRDLESAGRDLPVMEHMGINHLRHGSYKFNTILPRESGQKYPKYYINHSFMFDFKLGEYLVTPIIELANQYYPFNRDALIKMIKQFNRQFIDKLPRGFFPPDWCSYENINWDREGKAREYIWQDDPKYR